MIKKVILLTLLFAGILNAVNLNLNKNTYTVNEQITVNFTGMTVKHKDWIGIYPENKNNAWGNVLKWKWTNNITAGNLRFTGLPAGTYEVRAFYNNSFHLEARKQFTVGGGATNAAVTTSKENYALHENVTVNFTNLLGNNKDWLGIYPAGSSNAWNNVIGWRWTGGQKNGHVTFANNNLPAGNYEVRVFFRNTYHVEARHAFKVGGNNGGGAATVTTSKASYNHGETVTATFDNMSGHAKDWIAIYPAGSTNAWGNVVQWKWTDGKVQGAKSFQNLPKGDYEVRVFFRNSFKLEARHTFSVKVANGKAKIFIIGGSTTQNTSHAPGKVGWGSKLGSYMHIPQNLSNRARSSASSKSYKINSPSHYDWTTTKKLMKQSDKEYGAYLLIQISHNDTVPGPRYTEPGRNKSYYRELKVFVKEARDLGVTPVLLTLVNYLNIDSHTHPQYSETIRYLAEDEDVILLDTEYKSYIEFKKYKSTAELRKSISGGDNIHYNSTGAGIVASWVKELACQADQTLCSQFK